VELVDYVGGVQGGTRLQLPQSSGEIESSFVVEFAKSSLVSNPESDVSCSSHDEIDVATENRIAWDECDRLALAAASSLRGVKDIVEEVVDGAWKRCNVLLESIRSRENRGKASLEGSSHVHRGEVALG